MTFELPAWIDRGHLPLLGAGAASVVALLLLLAFLVARRRRAAAAGVTADREGGAVGAPSGEAEADGPRTAAQRFRAGLARSRTRLAARLAAALGSGGPDLDDELLRVLVESDVGPRSAQEILAGLGRLPADRRDVASVRSELRERIEAMVRGPEEASEYPTRPWVILVVGVNGVGKTTSIGKLAARHGALGRSVLLVAGDTFRAAAADQLEVWAGRTGAGLVRQAEGADPSSVVFDGMKAAVARDVDVVLVDTAGRLHTKTNLMEELRKVRRTIDRVLPGAPHEVLLVLDATTGQNAVSQARTFAEAVDVTGVVLTKLDGSARGGVVVAIRRELGLPVRWVGLGERAEDLEPFDAGEFARALVGDGEEG